MESRSFHSFHLPYITPEIEGVGGELKCYPSDFIVSEIPLYEPSGTGQHVWAQIQRSEMTTQEVIKALARIFEIKGRDIGYGGLKDKDGVTDQFFSISLGRNADLKEFQVKIENEAPKLKLLALTKHEQKLRVGHLKGNRFQIKLRNFDSKVSFERIEEIQKLLQERGVPNFYGPQRFGNDFTNQIKGKEYLFGKRKRGSWLGRFLISSYQSYLFNVWLKERIERGDFLHLYEGEVLKAPPRGGPFIIDESEKFKEEFLSGELSFTGPIFGNQMPLPFGTPYLIEKALWLKEELSFSLFKKNKIKGSRRIGRLVLNDLQIEKESGCLLFSFSLPPGSYATIVLREFMKNF